MKLDDVIQLEFTEPMILDNIYQMRVMVEAESQYFRPVDFRLNMIHIPLRSEDIEIIYDSNEYDSNVYKNDIATRTYYPPGSIMELPDTTRLMVLSYGPIKHYNGCDHVTVYTKMVAEDTTFIETISNKQTLEKIMTEMNKILLSNEELKNLLPQYSYNWMMYNETKVDDELLSVAHNILDKINYFEDEEFRYKQSYFANVISAAYTAMPTNTTIDMYKHAVDYVKPTFPIKYDRVSKEFRMKAILNWLIYITCNTIDGMVYDRLSLLNACEDSIFIKIKSEDNINTGKNIVYSFIMPTDSIYDYDIELTGVTEHLTYLSHNIEILKIFYIDKTTAIRSEIILDNKQDDNFDLFARLVELICGDHTELSLNRYYIDLPKNIKEVDSNYHLPDIDEDIPDDGESAMGGDASDTGNESVLEGGDATSNPDSTMSGGDADPSDGF